MKTLPKLELFNDSILSKYQIYNSIFMTLPFDKISNTGVLLPLFHSVCKDGFQKGKNPTEIVNAFFSKYQENPTEEEKLNLLFEFIQYIERQVVLFDAIEDAAFPVINNMDGLGTLQNLNELSVQTQNEDRLKEILNTLKVRIVLTAHPTQFYPGAVLGIITDLTEAIKDNDLQLIQKLLAQLGKTPFFKQKKPTPYDEAVSLIWYLENVFYYSAGKTFDYIQKHILDDEANSNPIINLGFWPGGDRDGNPFVTTEITLKVAERLKQSVLKNYYRDIRILKRRLTFKDVEEDLLNIELQLYKHTTQTISDSDFTVDYLIEKLNTIKTTLIEHHQSLFLEEVQSLINKVHLFGFHFASLDIRQDSRVHHNAFTDMVKQLAKKEDNPFPKDYLDLTEDEQFEVLSKIKGNVTPDTFTNEMLVKTLGSVRAVKKIQKQNGELGANRYIISNNQTALNIMQTFAMFKLSGFSNEIPADIIPLFETVQDLENASGVMQKLYENEAYRKHLEFRNNKQTIMLGFSDGTKDGGYLMSNWGIYKAKEELTKISRQYNITVAFFDGRGGPPARGGGKTHQFYASLGKTIEDKEIQLTIQGQTISSNFGTLESSQYNLEQLISAGIRNQINENSFSEENRKVISDLAKTSYEAYVNFKKHPKFLKYLEEMSTLRFYAKTNIGSRPSKRGSSSELVFSDLRAIPFVGSWSQLKQNVPGFFGVGTALKKYEDAGAFDKIVNLYNESSFFKTLLENSMMSLAKSFFELTAYMAEDEEFGVFWKLIHEEFKTTKRLLLKLTGYKELMEDYPASKASIDVRESIVLPLLTIQQFALKKIQELKKSSKPDEKLLAVYEKMVVRSLFGNINASRNSA